MKKAPTFLLSYLSYLSYLSLSLLFLVLSLSLLSIACNIKEATNPARFRPIDQVSLTPSRTSGVAPLMVHFEVETNSAEFHERDFTWNFGDTTSGTWRTTGKSKNTAKGAVSAHVFETPGTYTVTVTVLDGLGGMGTASVSIVVTDPDIMYADENTICVNPHGDNDFSGAPSGAQHISTDTISEIAPLAIANRRILFKRGASWSTGSIENWPENNGPVTIGAYGTNSDNPVITVVSGTETTAFLPLNYKEDWRVMDLTLLDSTRKFGFVGGVTEFRRFLFLRVRAEGFGVAMGWSHWNDPDGATQIDLMALVDCEFSDSASNVSYIGSERLVVLGCSFLDAHDSHVLRVWQAYKGVISNNIMAGSSLDTSTGRHALKLHGPDEAQVYSTNWDRLVKRTEYTIVSDNIFGSCGPWPVSIGPQDDGKDERLSNIIFERNRYSGDFGNRSAASNPLNIAFLFYARQVTVRNNIIDGANFGNYFTGIEVRAIATAPAPRDLWIYNNTIYKNGNPDGEQWIGVAIREAASSVTVRNNLVVFPDGISVQVSIDSTTSEIVASSNLLTSNNPFVDSDNVSALERSFELRSDATESINTGVILQSVFEDFAGNLRGVSGGYEMGAYEYIEQ